MKLAPSVVTLGVIILTVVMALITKKPIDLSSLTNQSTVCAKQHAKDSTINALLTQKNDSLVLLTTKLVREIGVLKVKQVGHFKSKKVALKPVVVSDTVIGTDLVYNPATGLIHSSPVDSNAIQKRDTVFIREVPKYATGGDSTFSWVVNWYPGDSVDIAATMKQSLRISYNQIKSGFLNLNRKYNVVIDSNNPNIQTVKSEYALRRYRYDYSLGVGFGYGLTYSNSKFSTNPYLGVNLNYNLLNFGKRWNKN